MNTNDQEFVDAIGQASKDNYLGNPDTIESILRQLAQKCVRRRQTPMSTEDASQADMEDCLSLARIFIGEDPNYTPVPNWNTRVISDYLATKVNATGTPQEIVGSVLVGFVVDIYKLYNYAADGATEDKWIPQIAGIVATFRDLLMGVEPTAKEIKDQA